MTQVLDVRPLRVFGERATNQPKTYVGMLRLSERDGCRVLTLVRSNGDLVLGPLLDPVLSMVDYDGLVLEGLEQKTGFPQEWQLIAARRFEGHPEFPPLVAPNRQN